MATIPTFADGGVLHASDLAFLENPPQGGAYQNTPQAALANNTATLITFDTLWYDTDPTMWAIGTPSRLIFNTPGKWQIGATVLWVANATSQRQLDLRKNAVGSATGGTRLAIDIRQASAAGSTTNSISTEVTGIIAGDYVEIFALQLSGGTLAFLSSAFVGAVSLEARWVGI